MSPHPGDPALAQIADDNHALIAAGGYHAPSGAYRSLRAAIDDAIAGTRLYRPDQLTALVDATAAATAAGPGAPQVEVTAESTAQAARRLAAGGAIAALNFASGRNPGGGYLRGTKAQEEDLARCSALYDCLAPHRTYYQANRASDSPLYTDHLLYSPAVPFFRDDRLALLEEPYLCSILTSPAPNAGEALARDPGAGPAIAATLARRAAMILAVAAERGDRRLILGAWGAGVFRNDPAAVADLFAELLASPRFAGAFTHVTFAIFDRSPDQRTLGIFQRRFR